MKKFLICLAIVGAVSGFVGPATAGNTATQTVTYQVAAINEAAISGDPESLIISTATAGSEPDEVSDATTTYAVTTNGNNKKITGRIDSNMPEGTTLKINLTAPEGATSQGDQVLSTMDTDLVTGISKKKGSSLTITYTFSATVEAGVVASDSKTVTLTITSGA